MKTTRVSFEINNEKVSLDVRPYETLLETLRERLALTGAKEACWNGFVRGMHGCHERYTREVMPCPDPGGGRRCDKRQ